MNYRWVGYLGFCLSKFIEHGDYEEIRITQHPRKFVSPPSPIEEKDGRFVKLPLSSRSPRLLLGLQSLLIRSRLRFVK